jgi:hypothetical protein
MSYRITSYTKEQARALNVVVKPSTVKGKKIDVFNKKGEKLASIGALGMGDYPTFMKKKGKDYADVRRRLYKQRHEKDRHKRGSAGFYADKLLWSLIFVIININNYGL